MLYLEDFKALLGLLLETHPGLEFLKATPEYQERYSETVIYRIFYKNDKGQKEHLTLREFRWSKLLEVLNQLNVEEDIHKVREYFSYEHFYVLYCKFWELDVDHDFLLTKEELSRYDGHSLNK